MDVGQRPDAPGLVGRQPGARRIVRPGIAEIKAGAVFPKGGLEPVHVRAVGGVGHTDDAGPVRAQQRQEIEVAGVVDQDGVARFDQETAQQVDGLGPGVGQQDPPGIDREAARGQVPGDLAAQRRQAQGGRIVRQRRVGVARDLAQGAADRGTVVDSGVG